MVVLVAIILLSLGMQCSVVLAADAPAPQPASSGGSATAYQSSIAGVIVSLLAFAAGFAYL